MNKTDYLSLNETIILRFITENPRMSQKEGVKRITRKLWGGGLFILSVLDLSTLIIEKRNYSVETSNPIRICFSFNKT